MPPWRSTTTCFSEVVAATASSTIALASTTLPRRRLASTVISATASAMSRRVAIASAPKPENSGITIAPILAAASIATTASGTLGM